MGSGRISEKEVLLEKPLGNSSRVLVEMLFRFSRLCGGKERSSILSKSRQMHAPPPSLSRFFIGRKLVLWHRL